MGIERAIAALKFKLQWYSSPMIADQWCETSAGTGLAACRLDDAVREQFRALGLLVDDLRKVKTQRVSELPQTVICSHAAGALPLHQCVSAHNEFDSRPSRLRDPDLEVCVYHDAAWPRCEAFAGFTSPATLQAAVGTQA